MNCPECGKLRTETGRIHRDGRCAECRKEHIQKYHKEHSEHYNKLRRARYVSDGDKVRQRNKKWRSENKEIRNRINNEWRKKNPEKGRRWERENPFRIKLIKNKSHFKNKYNMTLEQWQDMYASQEGKCAICKRDFDSVLPNVDHDHDNGKVRNLICTSCNFIVGVLEARKELVASCLEYIAYWKGVHNKPSITNE